MSRSEIYQDFITLAMMREMSLRARFEALVAEFGVDDAPALVDLIIGDHDIQAGLCAVAMLEVFSRKAEDFQKAQRG